MVRATLSRGLAGLALLIAAPGCVLTTPFHLHLDDGCAPPAAQVHATWDNRVRVTPDPVNGGAPQPVIAGRMYLFGQELDRSLLNHGKVVVDLYDMTGAPQTPPRMLERWQIDDTTLQKFRRKDIIGEGYTLVLPWGTFRPDVAQVKMHLCFQPEKGAPLYAEPSVVTLHRDTPLTITESEVLPAGHRQQKR